jgi:hypothetical protein
MRAEERSLVKKSDPQKKKKRKSGQGGKMSWLASWRASGEEEKGPWMVVLIRKRSDADLAGSVAGLIPVVDVSTTTATVEDEKKEEEKEGGPDAVATTTRIAKITGDALGVDAAAVGLEIRVIQKKKTDRPKVAFRNLLSETAFVEVADLATIEPLGSPVHCVVSVESGDPRQGKNWLFYSGQLRSQPDNATIDDFHSTRWRGDYTKLEWEHGFIQWLFPLFLDSGVNGAARALGRGEARLMRRDLSVAKRIVASYRMMLDFYGFALTNEATGEVALASDPPGHAKRRLRNLNKSYHNNLRISRILTSLGHLGFTRYKAPFVAALRSQVEASTIPHSAHSLEDFWAPLAHQINSQWYNRKTLEIPEDREDSVFFASLPSTLPAPAPPATS